MEEKKNLEVISDDGSSLNISPVYDHLNVGKPKSAEKKPTNIVIPKPKSEQDEENKEDEEENENEEM